MVSKKKCIITGAAGGIGKYLVNKFTEENYFVVAIDIDNITGQKLINDVYNLYGINIDFYCVDVSNGEKIKEFFEIYSRKYTDLQILINNAAIVGKYEDFLDIDFQSWDEVIKTNLCSVFYCSQCAAKIMKKGGFGRIINISSVDAIKPEDRFSHYATAKSGILGLTKSMALELSKFNILVNAILPGPITTEKAGTYGMEQLVAVTNRVVLHRLGEPTEVAELALFLASEKSGFITGSSIIIDGGFLLT